MFSFGNPSDVVVRFKPVPADPGAISIPGREVPPLYPPVSDVLSASVLKGEEL